VEDDGLGEELQVIWELEPGAQIIEKVALPEPTPSPTTSASPKFERRSASPSSPPSTAPSAKACLATNGT
jgi:hypothetical protein